MRPLRTALACLLALCGLTATMSARAWWNDEWAFRKEITVDGAAIGAGTATDVPVLLRLSLGNFGYFADTLPDGADLRIVAGDDRTPLDFHIERYDPQAQMAFIWVRVPQIDAGTSQKIYLYYGNPEAKNASNAAKVYDPAQVLTYHFGASAQDPQDATALGTQPVSFSASVEPASLINAGVRFEGAQAITVAPRPELQLVPEQGATMSAWVRTSAAQADAHVLELRDASGELVLGIEGSQAYARLVAGGVPVIVRQSDSNLALDTWHHLALRVGNGRLALFVNGVSAGEADVAVAPLAGTLTIGGAGTGGNTFIGDLDEAQFAGASRSDAWLRAAAQSQGMVAPLVAYGGDAQREGGGHESYFLITLRNVTVDGWVVIAILAVMLVASLLIMASKALFLNRVAKGNAQFLAEFRRLSDDPAALERREGAKLSDEEESAFEEGSESQLLSAVSKQGAFGVSTLWRLYHHGMRETMRRIEGQAAGAARARTLSPQSIEAIRATMDASLTRMTQRLSSQMVWLTISISGGPFLGLLGTVIGVMITFAAIAVSGDVNINAIAPGTAAALAATVAGLGVAIPCLFGYNYLNTRVKEITADMRVFVDEFVTRVAEQYS